MQPWRSELTNHHAKIQVYVSSEVLVLVLWCFIKNKLLPAAELQIQKKKLKQRTLSTYNHNSAVVWRKVLLVLFMTFELGPYLESL